MPGDTVTYRLQRDLPSSDIEGLSLIDYLPLPIFDIDDNTAPIVSRITSFSTSVSASPPAAGTAKFGPTDTFYALSGITRSRRPAPTIRSPNSVTFRPAVDAHQPTALNPSFHRHVRLVRRLTVTTVAL